MIFSRLNKTFTNFGKSQFINNKIKTLKIFEFTKISTIAINEFDRAMSAAFQDISQTIDAQCCEWNGVKLSHVLFVLYDSAKFLVKRVKIFDAHSLIFYSIFYYN